MTFNFLKDNLGIALRRYQKERDRNSLTRYFRALAKLSSYGEGDVYLVKTDMGDLFMTGVASSSDVNLIMKNQYPVHKISLVHKLDTKNPKYLVKIEKYEQT